ncbi:MAG: type I glyceraldehyde-3-phosphate dehydrogenase [Desulfuromonadales bacterium]|nr:type I glyceraldehyde-3-phosphate dehydrogenase [Desulfuromonadales bacterium]
MSAKVAINGFGRIGRNVLRVALQNERFELVAINDLADAATLAHLFKYDSVHGTFAEPVSAQGEYLIVGSRKILVCKERNPADLPWKKLGVDLAIEATGLFTKRDDAAKHLAAGAKKVVISAPGANADLTICMGVNEEAYDAVQHQIISNASCTTNCLAPVAKVLLNQFGIIRGMMTTVHSYTNDQKILDLPHKDLRRGRAANLSMIPTTTGATKALALVIPDLAGRFDGMAIRVPTPNVSLIDLVVQTEKKTTVKEVNAALKAASEGAMLGILDYCEQPLVSIDYNGSPASATVDALSTAVNSGDLVKVLAWYDNEWGYSSRICDLVHYVLSE